MLGVVLKRWNWLDDGLIPLTGAIMTAAWGYPLFMPFLRDPTTGVQNAGFTFWLCLAVLLGGLLAGRLASQNRMGTVIVVIGGMATILIALLLTVPAGGESIDLWFIALFRFAERGRLTGEILPVPLVVIVLVTMLWTRGVRLATIRHEGAVGAFVVGMVAMAGLLFVSSVLPSPGSEVGTQVRSSAWEGITTALVPMFLLTVPVSIVLSLMAPALGTWASTAGEISLVFGVVLLNLIMPFGPPSQQLAGWLLLFLASGLVTLALISVSSTLREQERLTGIRLQMDRYWVMIMLAVVGSVLLGGIIIGQIVAPDMVLRILGLLRPIWWVVRQALLYVILVFAYLFFSLIEPLLAELQNRPARQPQIFLSPVESEALEEITQEAAEIPPLFTVILQVLLIAGAVGVIALLFYMAVHRRERRHLKPDEVIETRETILSAALVAEQIQGLLDGLRRRRASFFVDLGPPGDPRRIVREMYQQVLARAMRRDAPRAKGQTPNAYGLTLAGLCPGEDAAVDTLTRVYTAARYGTEPLTESNVDAARVAFGRLQAGLQGAEEPEY